jgi:hypothetical protein
MTQHAHTTMEAVKAGEALPAPVQMYVDAARLTRGQVRELLGATDWTDRVQKIAWACYPEKATDPKPLPADVARQHGVSRQYVGSVKKRVTALFLKHGTGADAVPLGWMREVITLPPDLMKVVKDMQKNAFDHLRT